jgi:hypothetical protein
MAKNKMNASVAKPVVVKHTGFKHEHSENLFGTKEQCEYDWAVWTLRNIIDDCTYSGEFEVNDFLASLDDPKLKQALTILIK